MNETKKFAPYRRHCVHWNNVHRVRYENSNLLSSLLSRLRLKNKGLFHLSLPKMNY